MSQDDPEILRFFQFAHLPPRLQEASKPFTVLAAHIASSFPEGEQRAVALQRLLESKDAAVRSLLPAPATAPTPLQVPPAPPSEPEASLPEPAPASTPFDDADDSEPISIEPDSESPDTVPPPPSSEKGDPDSPDPSTDPPADEKKGG